MAKKKIKVGWKGNLRELEVTQTDADPAAWDSDSKLSVVGGRNTRLEGRDKVTGRAKYTADIQLPGMLIGVVLRSPHAHAKATTLNLKPAIEAPGVKAAIELEREPRFAGQAVAAIAADTVEQAREALRRIEVKWQVLPAATTMEDARQADAPRVMGGQNGNTRSGVGDGSASEEDVKAALEKSKHAIDLEFRTPVVTHCCLESHGSIASWEKDGALTVYDSTQAVFAVRDGLARALQLPANDVRILKEHMGGGFGSKLGMGETALIAARLAREAKAPVKLLNDRREEHVAGGNRPSSIQRLRLGCDAQGKLTVMSHASSGTGGAGGGADCTGPFRSVYKAPVKRQEHIDVLTNAGRAQAFRAPGHVQGMFSLECAIDALAVEAGFLPVEFRLLNETNELRKAQYKEGQKRIMAAAASRAEFAKTDPRARGMGCAASIWGGAGGPGAQVRCVIGRDGSVEVHCGTQDIGTGTRTIMAMIAAEELGLALEDVSVKLGDTSLPYSHGSGGSMTAPSVTPAVRAAAALAKGRVFEACASALGAEPTVLVAKGRKVTAPNGKSMSWKDACSKITGANVSEQATREKAFDGMATGTAGCQFAEVVVDRETGKVQVELVVAVHDCGRVVNPMLAESQIRGGVIQGISYALLEQRILDRATGRQMNANFTDYRIAGSKEIPPIDVVLYDVSNGLTNTGVMGIGEPPIIPTAAAIANAVSNAIGRRIVELPITPERVLRALGKCK